jgi:hypothetical protein
MMFARLRPANVAFWQHAGPALQLRLTAAPRWRYGD